MSEFKVYGKNVLIMTMSPDRVYSKLVDIIIPDAYVRDGSQGLVKQIGKDVKDVQVGDYVVYDSSFGGSVSDKHGTMFYMLPEHAVKCKIVQEPFRVEGLFHLTEDGVPFTATNESVFDCLKEAYQNQKQIVQKVGVIEIEPEPEEE